MNVQLRAFNGEPICREIPQRESFPAIIVLDEPGYSCRAFYSVGTIDNGKTGIYEECDTLKIVR